MYSDSGLLAQEQDPTMFYSRVEHYTAVLNALLMTMVSCITQRTGILYHDFFEITHLDVISVSKWKNGTSASGIPNKSATNVQYSKRWLSSIPAGYIDSIDMFVDSPPRPVVSVDIIEGAINVFFALVREEQNMILASRTNKALSEFSTASFSDAVIVTWTQIEVFLYEKLQIYAWAHPGRFDSVRRNKLKKEATASEVIEILEAAGELSASEYKDINQVRKVRNHIIHEGKVAKMEDAINALKLLEKIINEKTSQSIQIPMGIRMSTF